MRTGQALTVYVALVLLLAVELMSVGFSWGYRNELILFVTVCQFGLLLLFYLGIYRHRGWVQVFGWVYFCWLLVMVVFILGELQTR